MASSFSSDTRTHCTEQNGKVRAFEKDNHWITDVVGESEDYSAAAADERLDEDLVGQHIQLLLLLALLPRIAC
jgi:hypothetical protein